MIITEEHLTKTFVKNVLEELFDEYTRDVIVPCGPESFDEYVWQRLPQLGLAVYNQIGEEYSDLDEAVKEVM